MECEHCGAPVRDAGAFCSHCGGRRRPEPSPAHISATSIERFDLAERHPGHAMAHNHRPTLTTTPVTGAWVAVVSSLVLTVVTIGALLFAQRQHEANHRRLEEFLSVEHSFDEAFQKIGMTPPPRTSVAPKVTLPPRSRGPEWMLYVFVPICLLGVGAAARSLARAQRFVAAPVRHELAVVVDERVSVSRAGRSAITQYHATLQTRDGKRSEYLCEGQLAGRIAANDIGVAFLKVDHLVDFIRLDV